MNKLQMQLCECSLEMAGDAVDVFIVSLMSAAGLLSCCCSLIGKKWHLLGSIHKDVMPFSVVQ